MSKRVMKTSLIELTETHNLVLALNRLRNGGNSYGGDRWKRALYHALTMTGTSRITVEKIRQALELP